MSKTCIAFILLAILSLISPAGAEIIIVAPDGSGDFNTIQTAIEAANNGDVILVNPGGYDRINFYGKAITVQSIDPEDSSVVNSTIIDGGNSFLYNTVTFESFEGPTSVLNGFVIQNGRIGIYCNNNNCCPPSPKIKHCIIKNNGDFGIYGGTPTISDTTISETNWFGGGSDNKAAIWDSDGRIENCVISQNKMDGLRGCDGQIINCSIVSNYPGNGLVGCTGVITGCTVRANGDYGLAYCSGQISQCVVNSHHFGGLFSCSGPITNTIVSGNEQYGLLNCQGGIKNCTIIGNKGNGCVSCDVVQNCIILYNRDYGLKDVIHGSYNNIWNNILGSYHDSPLNGGDIHTNPLFAVDGYWDGDNWVDGNYHLKSEAGRWTDSGWVIDSVTSPCIDAGNPTAPINYEPNPNGGRINLGSDGGTDKASKSPNGNGPDPDPICTLRPSADINGDCKVNMLDFIILASQWLDCNLQPQLWCEN